jgi:hypothetical protein
MKKKPSELAIGIFSLCIGTMFLIFSAIYGLRDDLAGCVVLAVPATVMLNAGFTNLTLWRRDQRDYK